MYCSKCGKEISENAKFCSNCGNQIIEKIPAYADSNTVSKFYGKKKGIMIAITSVLLCLAIVIIIVSCIKSPEETLIDNDWYSEVDVNCKYYDWTDKEGYWFSADCRKIVFYSYGEAETTAYSIGDGGVWGPYSYEITSENVPTSAPWRKKPRDNTDEWEILDKNTLKYDGEYYLWDGEKETHCDCDDYDCKHEKTWFITKEYLRIGDDTYTSKKPQSLHRED